MESFAGQNEDGRTRGARGYNRHRLGRVWGSFVGSSQSSAGGSGLWLGGDWMLPGLKMGLFYLCALPSTVSSSVAMTAAARGNVPAAVFNATLSSLIGVFLTPLWVSLLLKSGGGSIPLGKVILDLV